MIELPIIPPPGKAARNEQRKAIAAACNALSVAFFVSAFLQPLISGQSRLAFVSGALMAFVAFQGALHYVLARVED